MTPKILVQQISSTATYPWHDWTWNTTDQQFRCSSIIQRFSLRDADIFYDPLIRWEQVNKRTMDRHISRVRGHVMVLHNAKFLGRRK